MIPNKVYACLRKFGKMGRDGMLKKKPAKVCRTNNGSLNNIHFPFQSYVKSVFDTLDN